METLRELKNRVNNINVKLANEINKKRWPLCSLSFRKEVVTVIENLQKAIAQLSSKGEQKLALKYVEYFCFSFVIRIYAIEKIKTRKNKKDIEINTVVIRSLKDFKIRLNLVRKTSPRNIQYIEDTKIKYIKIFKKKTGEIKVFRMSHLIDWVLQIQFYLLLDPLVDISLPELSFGFRKGKNANQVLTYLSNFINSRHPSKFHLLCLNVNKCSNTVFYKYTLKYFPFPKKYHKFLIGWLKVIKMCTNYFGTNSLSTEKVKKEKLNSKISQRGVLYPVIINVILAKVFENFFDDYMFPKWFKKKTMLEKNKSFKINRYIMNYVNDVKVFVTSKKELNYAKSKAEKYLIIAGICLNKKETKLYNLSKKAKFNWLGYTFLIFLKKDIRYTKLVSRVNTLIRKKKKNILLSTLFLYITNEKFKKIKQKLKLIIQKLKHYDLGRVIKEVNAILRSVAGYYSFFTNLHRLNYLDHFVHKVYWRRFINKFRYKGLRQINWVAKNFFIINKKLRLKAPLKVRKWHLHAEIPNRHRQIKAVSCRYLWEVKVITYYKMQSIQIMALSSKDRKKSPYIDKNLFECNQVKIMKLRQNWSESSQFNYVVHK